MFSDSNPGTDFRGLLIIVEGHTATLAGNLPAVLAVVAALPLPANVTEQMFWLEEPETLATLGPPVVDSVTTLVNRELKEPHHQGVHRNPQ